MPLTNTETTSLLAVKGVGKTVLQRLQQMGLDDVAQAGCGKPRRYFATGRSNHRFKLLEKQPASQSRHHRRRGLGAGAARQ